MASRTVAKTRAEWRARKIAKGKAAKTQLLVNQILSPAGTASVMPAETLTAIEVGKKAEREQAVVDRQDKRSDPKSQMLYDYKRKVAEAEGRRIRNGEILYYPPATETKSEDKKPHATVDKVGNGTPQASQTPAQTGNGVQLPPSPAMEGAGSTDYKYDGNVTKNRVVRGLDGKPIDQTDTVQMNHARRYQYDNHAAYVRDNFERRQIEDSDRFQRRMARLNAITDAQQKKYDEANYKNRTLGSTHQWENLGRLRNGEKVAEGMEKGGKAYNERLRGLIAQASELKGLFGKDITSGKTNEYNAIIGLIKDTHRGAGLTAAQFDAAEKKFGQYSDMLKGQQAYLKKLNDFSKDQIYRKEIGDAAKWITDPKQLKSTYDSVVNQKAKDAFIQMHRQGATNDEYLAGQKELNRLGFSQDDMIKERMKSDPTFSKKFLNAVMNPAEGQDAVSVADQTGLALAMKKYGVKEADLAARPPATPDFVEDPVPNDVINPKSQTVPATPSVQAEQDTTITPEQIAQEEGVSPLAPKENVSPDQTPKVPESPLNPKKKEEE